MSITGLVLWEWDEVSFNDGFNIRSVPWPANTPVSGNSLVYDGTQWIAADSGGASGDITAVNAGTNMTGGGASGDVTISLSSSVTGLTNVQTTNLSGTHITGSDIKINYVDFNTGLPVNPTFQTGRLYYDVDANDLQYNTVVPGASINLGQQLVVKVKNNTFASLSKGKLVRINGGLGNNPTIATASWENDANSANTLGMLMQTLAHNDFGYVLLNGVLIGVDTNTFSAGQTLYLSSSGDYTNQTPIAPKHTVRIGEVVRVGNSSVGSIFISIQNGYEIQELHDVLVSSSANGDLLAYDSSTSLWKNTKTLSGSYTVTGSITASNFVGTASLASDLRNKLNLVSTLTYDPSIVTETTTVFNSWDRLWTAYLQTSGAVDIFLEQGLVIPTTTASYDFRQNTKLVSHRYPFGAQITVTIPSGTMFKNVHELDSVKLQASSSSPTLSYTQNNPHLLLSNGASLISSKDAPLIFWDANPSTSQLNVTLGYNAKLLSGSFPVIQGKSTATYSLFLGQGSVVENNTLAGDSDTNVTVVVKDGSNQFSFTQSSLSGTINNNTFNSNSSFDISYDNTILSTKQLYTQQLNVFSPTLSYAPVGVFQGFSTQTTSSNPEAFSNLAIPPVISAILEVYIAARDVASSDTATWKYKGMIIGDGTGAYSGSLGLVQDFHDSTAGASTWNISASYNVPSSGDVRFYAIGENSKTINWALYQTVTIVLGV